MSRRVGSNYENFPKVLCMSDVLALFCEVKRAILW
jgi:hypothetical protein